MGHTNNSKGFSLVEIIITVGIMTIVMLGFLSLQDNQQKSNNYLEFQLKTTQLQNSIEGLVLTDPANCACIFAGANTFAAVPAAPGATLTGFTAPTSIGRYNAGCAGIPLPLVTAAGVDGISLASVQLTNIQNVAGVYLGTLVLDIASTKQVLGPRNLPIQIPVSLTTTPAGPGTVSFQSCSRAGSAGGADLLAPNGYTTLPNGLIIQWGTATAWANAWTNINFPMPFPNQVFSATLSGGTGCCNAKDNAPAVRNIFNTHIQAVSSLDYAVPVRWMAIGQ